jgi:hypothetical protein
VARGFDEEVMTLEAADARSTKMEDRNNTLIQGVASTIGIVALAEGFAAVFISSTPRLTETVVGAAVFATVVLGKSMGAVVGVRAVLVAVARRVALAGRGVPGGRGGTRGVATDGGRLPVPACAVAGRVGPGIERALSDEGSRTELWSSEDWLTLA